MNKNRKEEYTKTLITQEFDRNIQTVITYQSTKITWKPLLP